jgi:hypothetical protein
MSQSYPYAQKHGCAAEREVRGWILSMVVMVDIYIMKSFWPPPMCMFNVDKYNGTARIPELRLAPY